MPTVARLPLGPMVNFAPRGPNESDPPDLLRFRVTPGAILIRLQKRKAIFFYPYSTQVSCRSQRYRSASLISHISFYPWHITHEEDRGTPNTRDSRDTE